jgi:hypothetical protein
MPIARESAIEVVVYVAVCIRKIHVELQETSCEIKSSFGTHPRTTLNIPAARGELWTTVVDVEVVA